MAERMRFILDGDDRLSPVLDRAGDSATRLHRRLDGATRASSSSVRAFTRDANGQLRDLQGRFVSVAHAARLIQDSNGRWRDLNGRFIASATAARRMTAVTTGLPPALRAVGDAAAETGARMRQLDGDTDSAGRTITQVTASVNGRLRDSRGRFVSAAGAVGSLGEAAAGAGSKLGGMGAAIKVAAAAAGLSLLPAMGALVPMMAGAGLAAGTLKLGFDGVGEALEQAGEDQEKYQELLKKLGPEQRELTKELASLKGEFKSIGKDIQKAMLPGFTKAVKDAGPVVEILGDAMTELGKGFGKAAEGAGRLFKDSGFQKDLRTNLDLGRQFVGDMMSGFGQLSRSLLDFGAASKPTLNALSGGIRDLLGKGLPGMFDGLKVGIEGSAKFLTGFFAMINKVLPAIGRFAGEAARAFGPLLGELAESAGDRLAAVLDTVGAGLKALSPVFKDLAFGVKAATQVFRIMAPTIKDTAGAIIGALLPSFSEVDKARGPLQRLSGWIKDNKMAIQEVARIFGSAIIDMTSIAVTSLPGVIRMFRLMSTGIVTALGGILHGAASAFGWIPGIGGKLKAADREFGKFKDSFIGGLEQAERSTREFAEKAAPRLRKNKLLMNIKNWESQIGEAKRLLSDKNLPPKKRAKLEAEKKQLEQKVASAKRDLKSIKDKTAKIKGDKQNFDSTVSAVQRKKMPTKTARIKGDAGNFWDKVGSIAGRVVGTAVINLVPGGGLLSKLGLRDGGLVRFASGGLVGGFPSGGLLRGPGTGTSDSILARVSNGEFVIRAASVQKYGLEFFQTLNEGRFGTAAARPVTGRPAVAARTAGTVINIHVGGVLVDQLGAARAVRQALLELKRTNGGTELGIA